MKRGSLLFLKHNSCAQRKDGDLLWVVSWKRAGTTGVRR